MLEFKIEGLDRFTKDLKELSDAAKALDGSVCELKFDPSDRDSVDAAIAKMEAAVDARIARWKGNSAVRALAEKSKQDFRRRILDQVAEWSRCSSIS